MNSRFTTCSGSESPQAAEAWMLEWMEKVFEKIDVPQTFLLSGHSVGAWLAALYASKCPERVESLFMMSPAGTIPYNPKTYDPYNMKDPNDVTKERMAKKEVDKMLFFDEQKKHWLDKASKLPLKMLIEATKMKFAMETQGEKLTQEEIDAIGVYIGNAYKKLSLVDVVQRMPFKYFFYAIHPLQAVDRLSNPKIDFPIGIAFGDRDFFGSDHGAD